MNDLLPFCHYIFSGSCTHKVEHSSGLRESVSNQSVSPNLSTLNHTVRKWNEGSQTENSGQLAVIDLHAEKGGRDASLWQECSVKIKSFQKRYEGDVVMVQDYT